MVWATIFERLDTVASQVDTILQAKQREKSDLMTMNSKLAEGIDALSRQVLGINKSIESLCTISLCLIESQCMQIRSEEQDDQDKAKISLMG